MSGVTGVGVSLPSAAQLLGILLRSQRAVNIELRCGNLYRDDLVLLEFRPSRPSLLEMRKMMKGYIY